LRPSNPATLTRAKKAEVFLHRLNAANYFAGAQIVVAEWKRTIHVLPNWISLKARNMFAILSTKSICWLCFFYSNVGGLNFDENPGSDLSGIQHQGFDKARPSDAASENYFEFCVAFFNALIAYVPEYKKIFKQGIGKPGDYRIWSQNRLLFRPSDKESWLIAWAGLSILARVYLFWISAIDFRVLRPQTFHHCIANHPGIWMP
jgi:hypothetical protein